MRYGSFDHQIEVNDFWNRLANRMRCPKCGVGVWWHIGWGGRHCRKCGHHESAPVGL
jgi:ribosomal protein L37AE/L43A